jgi:Bacterial Ig-like domain (group 3)
MRIRQPRIGIALVSAALLTTGATSTMFAAQAQAQGPTCYSVCPPRVDLKVTFRVLHVGAEEIEDFSVRVGPDVIGSRNTPTGTVTIKADSTVLCTITLVNGRGSCSPSASALPAGNYEVVASYSGDSNFSPASSLPQELRIVGGGGPGGGGGFPGGFGTLLSFFVSLFSRFFGFAGLFGSA